MKHLIFSLLGAMVVTGVLAEGHIEGHATRAAISALYVAGDEVQSAIVRDYCGLDSFIADDAGKRSLSGEALRQYEHVEAALMAAFEASPHQGDEALGNIANQYCEWAGER